MATIFLPRYLTEAEQHLTESADVVNFLYQRNIPCARWVTTHALSEHPAQDEVLTAYHDELQPFMQSRGYLSADVIHVDTQTPNLAALHEKFIREHTHSEDEVRFFVRGFGDFWFHLHDDGPDGVFCVRASAGDLLAVPAGIRHWFDFGPEPNVTVIRLFTDTTGWEPHYTGESRENIQIRPEAISGAS